MHNFLKFIIDEDSLKDEHDDDAPKLVTTSKLVNYIKTKLLSTSIRRFYII